jgi:hypothetical protein
MSMWRSADASDAAQARDPYGLMTGEAPGRETRGKKRDPLRMALIVGLAVLSWVATFAGMLELIEANVGELPLVHKIIIGGSVGMLMAMVVWLLDQLFTPAGFIAKLLYLFGYVFLSAISIGFSFGFYWKVLESRGEGTRSAEAAIGQVQAPLQTATARMETLSRTLEQLKTTSQQKAEIERTQGTSCPNSRPGDGPRRKLRDDDAARFAFASDFVKPRIAAAREDIAAIEGDLSRLLKAEPTLASGKENARVELMRSINRRLETTVTSFNAFRTDPQLRQIRTELAERAEKSQFIDTQGKPYSCPDQGLATMVRSVVASIDALPQLEKPKIANVEGSEATIEAFRRLGATVQGLMTFKLPPSADELRELQRKAVAQAEAGRPRAALAESPGLSQRDYIPLAIAVFVDLCLLLVSIGKRSNRLDGLVDRMDEAGKGPMIQILSRFAEIHADPRIRENFELFRHVVFDLNGDYYAAVPLDAPQRMNPEMREEVRREALLLANFFTAFENERIFDRVPLPYVTTKNIRKRLWRQGSKFAHSESFRLYKFRRGAWSEVVLGAVMGAAVKVERQREDERRTLLAARGDAAATPPPLTLDATPTRPQPAVPGAGQPVPSWHMPAPQPVSRREREPRERPAAQRAAETPVADLAEHKRRLAEAAEVHMPDPANSNTAPAEPADRQPAAPAPTQAAPDATAQSDGAIRVEAVERTMTWHVLADSDIAGRIARASTPPQMQDVEPTEAPQLAPPATAETGRQQDDIAVDRIAGRFAAGPQRG